MRFNDLPEQCKSCQNLKTWGLDMGGNHLVGCKEAAGIFIRSAKSTRRKTMSDYINRQAAIDAMSKTLERVFPEHRQIAEKCLNALPSAQPEIIRCKDCKWFGRADKRRFYRGMDCLQKHIDTIVPDRDFCSKAERRGEQDG